MSLRPVITVITTTTDGKQKAKQKRSEANQKTSDATVNKWWRAYAAADFIEIDDQCAFHHDATLKETRRLFNLFYDDVRRLMLALNGNFRLEPSTTVKVRCWLDGDELALLLANVAQLAEAVEWGESGAKVATLRKLARKHLSRSKATEEQIRKNVDRVLRDGGVK